jgi:hypothetical protein
MASAVVATTNPVTNPTAAQLAQKAADISIVIANAIRNGVYSGDVYDTLADLASAINLLAQAGLTVNNATASSVGTVNVRNAYAANQAIPTVINTSAV